MSLRPVTPQNSMGQNLGQINDMVRQLNRERVAKTFKQPGGSNAIVTGKLPFNTTAGNNAYGILLYDSNGIPNIILGIQPDGEMAIVAAKEGENVIEAYS